MEDNEPMITRRSRARDQVAIDINEGEVDLVNSMKRKMEEISSSHCICRVRESLRRGNERSYVPDKVSIGPYHHGREELRQMEDHKWRYVHTLLNRKPCLDDTLNDCVIVLKDLEHLAKACYVDHDQLDLSNNEFLEIMLIDGCFMIELFLKYAIRSLRRGNDPIFNTPGMLFDLRCNLILLENQIPWFVLQRLFQVIPIPKTCTYSLGELAFYFFRNMIPGDHQSHQEKFHQDGHHLLDLICHCLLPTYPKPHPKKSKSERHLRCATELQSAGVQIRKARTENLLDIQFVSGVLEIPRIRVHQYTEFLLRNLIALEECSSDHVQHITSYVVLIKSLICSDNDVKLLNDKQILTNHDTNETEISAHWFEKLSAGVDLKESYFEGLCEQVNGYTNTSPIHVWTKKLKHSYRKNRTLRLILFIALLVLSITIVAALFSVLSFLEYD